MVYISDDGRVLQSTPWSLNRFFRFFTGILYMIIMLTLIDPDSSARQGGGGSGEYSSGPGSGWPPRPPATRRLGRPNTGNNLNIPFGGCRSCAG